MRRQTIIARQSMYHTEMTSNLLHMIRFIDQEGSERAEEIECQTDEEVNMMKGELIQTARLKINKEYDTKEIDCVRENQIFHGKIMTQSKMLIVNAKIELFDEMSRITRTKVEADVQCAKRRFSLLQLMIIETLYRLLEKEVVIRTKKIDATMVEKTIPNIQEHYEKVTKKKVKISMDDTFLPEDYLPGVILRTPNNRISIKNTLDDRLQQIMRSSLPAMNQVFFGTSKMRK